MVLTRVRRSAELHPSFRAGDRSVSRRLPPPCMLTRGGTVRLQIHSNFEMLDFVQVVSDRMGQLAGLDEDAVHWIGVAVRESVINAIKHGNREDYGKLVTVEFALRSAGDARASSSSASSTRARASIPRKSPTRSRRRTSSSRAAAASSSCAASWTTCRCGAASEGRHGSAHGQEAGRPVPEPIASGFPRHRHRSGRSAPATCRWRTSAAIIRVDKKGAIDLVTEIDLRGRARCSAR